MFESAEIGHAIDKETYDTEVPALREALLEVQYELQQQKRFPVIILINGVEGAGKGETVKLLNEWMDPRLIEVRTFDQQTDEELDNLIGVRSRAISRKLRAVQTMDESAAAALLELDAEPGKPVAARLPENGDEL